MQKSEYIRSRQARETMKAGRHSYRMGKPLNWQVTIDFGFQDEGDELKPSKNYQDIRKRFWSWWDYKRKRGQVTGRVYDIYTWEAPDGKQHVNWLIYIPENLLGEACSVIENRCEKVIGRLNPDTVHQQAIYNLTGVLRYVLKGTETEYAKKIDIRPKKQGTIWCRRAVPSRALGKMAREQDWRSEAVVISNKSRGLAWPREKRVIERENNHYYSSY